MIRVKDSTVKVAHLSSGILFGLQVADQVYTKFGYETVITSGNDGGHGYTSLHYNNDAVDLRTRHMKTGDPEKVRDEIDSRLGLDWDVILESDHLHLECQPRHRL